MNKKMHRFARPNPADREASAFVAAFACALQSCDTLSPKSPNPPACKMRRRLTELAAKRRKSGQANSVELRAAGKWRLLVIGGCYQTEERGRVVVQVGKRIGVSRCIVASTLRELPDESPQRAGWVAASAAGPFRRRAERYS
jgi:hypothetical protein